jgi:hypothetical protein
MALQERLRELRVVSVFSRLHPLLPQQALVEGLGEYRSLARTVSIDLTLPLETQRAAFRKNHKEGINKLRRKNVTCVRDPEGTYLEAFLRIYYETMDRVGAADAYFFPSEYFGQLVAALGPRLNLFVCLQDGQAVCGGLFIECCGMLQYHLGGTLNSALKLAPMKLLIDDVRLWGAARGLKTFHLGGGATPRADDPLLHFKMGFSTRVHEFAVWRWVLFPEVYRRLCEDTACLNEAQGLRPAVPGFFPEYRCPTIPGSAPAPALLETSRCSPGENP